MSTTRISRRKFLGLTLSATALSMIERDALGLPPPPAGNPHVDFVRGAYRLSKYENLLNLDIYFVCGNPERLVLPEQTGGKNSKILIKGGRYEQDEAYMIVRLPQQHIAEEYVIDRPPPDGISFENFQGQTRIAGYSFLVFKLMTLPGELNFTIALSQEALLDWNSRRFRLVVRQNLKQSIFTKEVNQYPIGYTGPPFKFDPARFPRAAASHLDPNPITIIEAPYRLYLSPLLPDQDQFDFAWQFTGAKTFSLSRATNIKKVENELWTATLTIRSRTIPNFGLPEAKILPPIGVATVGTDTTKLQDFKFLPTPKDKEDLVRLYIHSKLAAQADKFTFTPLGITTRIAFKNTDLVPQSGTKDSSSTRSDRDRISLYDWQQNIAFGRDEEVVVTNLWVDAETGLKMLVVRTTKRVTIRGNAVLVYREYVQPLDPAKNYALGDIPPPGSYQQETYKTNIPFMRIEFDSLDRKQIISRTNERYKDPNVAVITKSPVDSPEEIVAFWPLDFHTGEDLVFKVKLFDWAGKETTTFKKFFLISESIHEAYYQLDGENKIKIESANGETITLKTILWEQIENLFGNNLRLEISKYKQEYDLRSELFNERLNSLEDGLQNRLSYSYHSVIHDIEKLRAKMLQVAIEIGNLTGEFSQWYNLSEFKRNFVDKPLAEEKLKVKEVASIISYFVDFYKTTDKIRESIDEKFSNQQSIYGRSISRARQFLDNLDTILKGVAFDSLKAKIGDGDVQLVYGGSSNSPKFDQDMIAIFNNITQFTELESKIRNKIDLARQDLTFAVNTADKVADDIASKIDDTLEDVSANAAGWYEENVEVINKEISKFETEYIILSASLKLNDNTLDFYDEHACFPQLHSARVYSRSVEELINYKIPMSIRLASEYYKNQVSATTFNFKENASAVFAEIAEDTKQQVRSAMLQAGQELGGIISPALPGQYITYLAKRKKDLEKGFRDQVQRLDNELDALQNYAGAAKSEIEAVKRSLLERRNGLLNQIKEAKSAVRQDLIFISNETREAFDKAKDWGEQQFISAQDFFKGLDTKLLGTLNLKDILGQNFDLPKFVKFTRGEQEFISYNFSTDSFVPLDLGLFSFNNFRETKNGILTNTNLKVYLEKPLPNIRRPEQLSGIDVKSFTSQTSLNNFQIGILQKRLIVNFETLSITTTNTTRKVDVKLGEISFAGELAFVESLARAMSTLTQTPGLNITLQPAQISVTYGFAIPNISGGIFNLSKLRFVVGVTLPLPVSGYAEPMSTSFAIGAKDDKFVVSAGIFGGRGYFMIETQGKRLKLVEAAIEFGGYLGINLGGIASGEVYLMVGIFFSYNFADQKMTLAGYLVCGGAVSVFGFISVSVQFYLALVYENYQGQATLYGTASATYSIKIGFFRKSFTLTFSKRIAGANTQNGEIGGQTNRRNDTFQSGAFQNKDTAIPHLKGDPYHQYEPAHYASGSTRAFDPVFAYDEQEGDIFDTDSWEHYINAFDPEML